jgi:hypothetical protein
MPAATFVKFQDFVEQLGKGVHQLHAAGHTLKVYLTNNTPSASEDAVKGDLAGITEEHGYAAADIQNDYTETAGLGTLTAVDVVFTASGGSFGPFRYAVIYNDTPTSPADPLVAYFDYGSSITTLEGETFTVDFGDSLLTLT